MPLEKGYEPSHSQIVHRLRYSVLGIEGKIARLIFQLRHPYPKLQTPHPQSQASPELTQLWTEALVALETAESSIRDANIALAELEKLTRKPSSPIDKLAKR